MKEALRKILENHQGRDNTIARKELWRIFGITTESEDRKMRDEISQLRKEGFPIMFATSKPSGYYLPASLKEVEDGKTAWKKTIRDECITLAALKKYGARFVQREEQLVLIK